MAMLVYRRVTYELAAITTMFATKWLLALLQKTPRFAARMTAPSLLAVAAVAILAGDLRNGSNGGIWFSEIMGHPKP